MPSRRHLLLLLTCTLADLFSTVQRSSARRIATPPAPEQNPARPPVKPSVAEVEKAISLAGAYLKRACGPDGKFIYEVDINTGRQSTSYDIIRHAGAIYSLAMLNDYHPDPEAVSAIVRAATYMREHYMGDGPTKAQKIVWSQPITGRAIDIPDGGKRTSATIFQQNYAELGGAGLGLVALACARKVKPGAISLRELRGLGQFILFLQNEDGSFKHKYREKTGPEAKWKSLYYPGEAALGLVNLYDLDPNPNWLRSAGRALRYLANNRVELTRVPADHWALIATARILPYCNGQDCGASREELVHHAIQICNSILRDQVSGSAAAGLDGAFDFDGRTTSVATRSEGLEGALEFLMRSELRDKVEAAAGRAVAFLLRVQLVSGVHAGGMPGAMSVRARENSEIRIDYVQHALCAWLGYASRVPETRARSSP